MLGDEWDFLDTYTNASAWLFRNPLDDIPHHLFLPPVVKPGRSRFRVSGKVLDIFQRHALREQVGDRRHPETGNEWTRNAPWQAPL
ncbi:MAG: hypothetical protein P4L84_34275 [Isosphaeraceae bacterium]|nr:hypothetical protein [Isosphaeraceae bacterium]